MSHSGQRSARSTACLPHRRICYYPRQDRSASEGYESEWGAKRIPDDVWRKAHEEGLELARCAGVFELRLEPCSGDTRAIGKRVTRLDPGHAVFVCEIANVAAHTIDGDAVDDGGDDGIKFQGSEELADAVDGLFWDGEVWDGCGWDWRGFPVAREEGRERMGGGLVWDGDEGVTEGGVVVEQGKERFGFGCKQHGLVVAGAWDDSVLGAKPLEEIGHLSVVGGRSEGDIDGGFLEPDELLVASWQGHDDRRAALNVHTSGPELEHGLVTVDAIEAICKTRLDGDVGVWDGEENSSRGHRVQRRARSTSR